ncbi:EpsG family protein [Exiguobacterium sp. s50]|uniref:EpsG family protein n=1 Tax=Exiguobacterium sp. s50 TaxID=2751234 RepID=UPI001BE5B0B3|nr:EpsG family protein [Exiguobacterium sp. s50]
MVHFVFLIVLVFTIPMLNKKYPFLFFSFVILFLFMALRYDYGNDYMGYFNIHFQIQTGLPSWGANDYLYYTLNNLVPNFSMLIAIISLFYLCVVWYLIKQNLKFNQYWIAMLILLINPYLFLIHLSSLRQTLAICFFIIAVKFAIERKWFMYLVLVIIAIGMHASAIVLLPLYFLLTDKPFKTKDSLFTIIIVGILLFTSFFDQAVSELLKYFPSHYEYYFNERTQNSLRATLLSSVFFLMILLNLKKLKGKEIIYGKLSLIATIMSILAFKISMMNRFGMYFDIFLIITLPHIFTVIKNRYAKIALFMLIITIYLLRYYSFFSNPLWESFKDYKTIL